MSPMSTDGDYPYIVKSIDTDFQNDYFFSFLPLTIWFTVSYWIYTEHQGVV